MSTGWDRRALLTSLGTVLLAGCTGKNAPQTGSKTTGTDTETANTPTPPDQISSSWPMPAADPGRSNFAPDASGPTEEIAALWETPTDDTGLSQPVLSDGTVYVGGTSGTVRALSARTGTEQWQQSVGTPTDTPWVLDDRLYVPTEEGVVALGTDGTEQWRVSEQHRVGFLGASHGLYYVRDGDSPVLVSHAHDGTKRWETTLTTLWEPHLFASDETVFLGTGGDATQPWRFSPATGTVLGRRVEPPTPEDVPTEVCYSNERVYTSRPIYGEVAAFESAGESYERDWWYNPEPTQAGGTHLAPNETHLFTYLQRGHEVLGIRTGTVDWRAQVATHVQARPVVAQTVVLFPTEDRLVCFDPASGKKRWQRSREGIGERFIVADDLLYTTVDGTIRAFRPP